MRATCPAYLIIDYLQLKYSSAVFPAILSLRKINQEILQAKNVDSGGAKFI